MDRTEVYDDIVAWVTIDELRIKAGCTGSPLKIVTESLYQGTAFSAYSATVIADGGVPYSSGGSYKWCRQESAPPAGLTFTPSTEISDCLGLDEALWTQADEMVISGTPLLAGTFPFKFFVRDDNDSSGTDDNIAKKSFIITINLTEKVEPPPALPGCADYRVWNNYGSGRDYNRDSDCDYFSNDSEVSTESRYLNSGETFYRYSSTSGTCSSQQASLTFAEAETADADGDCCVNFSGSDRACAAACTDYRVWNDLGYSRYFKREGDCDSIASGDEVTSESRFLSSGEDLRRYDSSSCSWGLESTLTFSEAQSGDYDGDCCLYFNGSDRDCYSGSGGGGWGGGGWGGGGWGGGGGGW
jgi:hypothetical protein